MNFNVKFEHIKQIWLACNMKGFFLNSYQDVNWKVQKRFQREGISTEDAKGQKM